jgi:hypothetical protein
VSLNDNRPAPEAIARENAEGLTATLAEFEAVAAALAAAANGHAAQPWRPEVSKRRPIRRCWPDVTDNNDAIAIAQVRLLNGPSQPASSSD